MPESPQPALDRYCGFSMLWPLWYIHFDMIDSPQTESLLFLLPSILRSNRVHTRLFPLRILVFLDENDTLVERLTLATIALGTTKVLDPDLANHEPGWDEGDGPQAKVECRGADALERFERVQSVRDGLCLRRKGGLEMSTRVGLWAAWNRERTHGRFGGTEQAADADHVGRFGDESAANEIQEHVVELEAGGDGEVGTETLAEAGIFPVVD